MLLHWIFCIYQPTLKQNVDLGISFMFCLSLNVITCALFVCLFFFWMAIGGVTEAVQRWVPRKSGSKEQKWHISRPYDCSDHLYVFIDTWMVTAIQRRSPRVSYILNYLLLLLLFFGRKAYIELLTYKGFNLINVIFVLGLGRPLNRIPNINGNVLECPFHWIHAKQSSISFHQDSLISVITGERK